MMKNLKRWWLLWRLQFLVKRQRRIDAVLMAAELDTQQLRQLHRDTTQALGQRRTELRTALIRL